MSPAQATIVVADDNREMADLLCDVLRQAGYNAFGVQSGAGALSAIERELPDLLISDLRMSGMNGHQLQLEVKRVAPELPVIIITAFGSIQSAVESMKLGAFDYITKPFGNDELLLVVSRALEKRQLHREIKRLRSELAHSYGLTSIITADPKMLAVLDKLQQIADSGASVLICGESGTGKELLARALHFESKRCQAPFVPVNCAAIPENLIESELFGFVRGTFTDARQSKTGLFQAASGGTLFFDEIGEMPLALQSKLLRAIEDKKIRPLGATDESPVDVRIVAATNTDLESAVAQHKFRSDLYYRLATFILQVPPLRERPNDIPLLVKHFAARTSAESNRPVPEVEAEAIDWLIQYRWPGNVRELQNAIQSAVILCRGNKLKVDDLPTKVVGGERTPAQIASEAVTRKLTLEEMEREYVRLILRSVAGNKTEAATILRIDRKTLYRKLAEPESVDL